jgi:cell wall-associated NlpC family hydrolase
VATIATNNKQGGGSSGTTQAAILVVRRQGIMWVLRVLLVYVLPVLLILGLVMAVLGAQSSAQCGDEGAVGGKNNTEIAYNILVGEPELDPVEASAIVGNNIHEDGHDPLVPNQYNTGGSGAFGIAQWLGGRLVALKQFHYQGHTDWQNDIYLQVAYLWHELRDEPDVSGHALAILHETRSIADPMARLRVDVVKFEAAFERSGDTASYPARITAAESVYKRFGKKDAAAPITQDPFGCSALGVPGNASAQAVKAAADQLDAMHVPYNYGGGHVNPARPTGGQDGPFPGLDCSAAVSWVLQHAGLKIPTMTSGLYADWRNWGGQDGPGLYVTIYANPGHVFMKIGNSYFGTSGFGHPAAGGGAAWFTVKPSKIYLDGFTAVHPPGL